MTNLFSRFQSLDRKKIIDNINLNSLRDNKLNLNSIEIDILESLETRNLNSSTTSDNFDNSKIENQSSNSTKNNNVVELKTIFKRATLSIEKKKRKRYKAYVFFEKSTQSNFLELFKELFSKLSLKTRKHR